MEGFKKLKLSDKILKTIIDLTETTTKDWKQIKLGTSLLSVNSRKEKAYRNKLTDDEARGILSETDSIAVFVYQKGA